MRREAGQCAGHDRTPSHLSSILELEYFQKHQEFLKAKKAKAEKKLHHEVRFLLIGK